MELNDGTFFDLRILDTTYFEGIENNVDIYDCDLFIYVFDVTNYSTFWELQLIISKFDGKLDNEKS